MQGDEARLRAALVAVVNGGKIGLVGQGIGRVLTALVTTVLSVGIGPAGYGLYELGMRTMRVLNGLTRGSSRAVSRFYPARETPAARAFVVLIGVSTAAVAGGVLGGVLALAGPTVARVTGQPATFAPVLGVMGAALVASAVARVTGAVLRCRHEVITHVGLRKVVHPGVRLLVAGVAVLAGGSAVAAGVGVGLAAAVVAAAGAVAIHRRGSYPWRSPTVDADTARRFLGFGGRLSLSGLGGRIQFFGFFPVMAYFVSPAAAGFFAAAFVISSLVRWPLAGINQLMPAVAADLYSDSDEGTLRRLHAVTSRLILLVAAPIAALLLVHGGTVLGALSSAYAERAHVFPLFVVARLGEAGVGSVGILLASTDNDRAHLRLSAVVTGATVVVTVWLTAAYGVTGTAVAFCLVRLGNNLGQLTVLNRLEGFQPFGRAHLTPVVGGVVAAFVTAVSAGALAASPVLGRIAWSSLLGVAAYVVTVRWIGLRAVDTAVLRAVAGGADQSVEVGTQG